MTYLRPCTQEQVHGSLSPTVPDQHSGQDHGREMMKGLVCRAATGNPGWPGEPATAEPGGMLSLSCGAAATTVTITFTGELDLASAEYAFGYVKGVIDRHQALVALDLSSLAFCDARGLGTLVRMSNYAGQAGRALWLVSPQPQLAKLMRITGLDSELLVKRCDAAGHVAC
jgi:anti-sigma B factor antagonist